ncbi:hypothetical protein Tco_1143622 [Tanacetum coccineum]
MNQDYYKSNPSGFDQFQPSQFPVNYPPQETNKEILQAREDLMEAIQAFLKEYDHIPPNEKCMALLLAKERFLKIKQTMEEEQNQPEVMQELLLKLMNDLQILRHLGKFCEIKDALMDKQYRQEDIQELMSKLLEDVRNISEELSEYINYPSWNRPTLYDDEYTVIWRRPKAITPDEPSEEPEDPLIMREEELSTIPEKDKSSIEDLVLIPSGSKGFSDDICDDESLLSRDIPITSPKIDFLSKEFAGELAPILPGMNEDEFDEEEDDCYDYDTSSDDDSYENIEYVKASPLNLEIVSLEEVNEDQEEKEFDLEDILQIQDVILHEKLLNINRLIANIESLNDNPTPDYVLKSSSLDPISITDSDSSFEKFDTSFSHLDNFLPEFETFSDHTEETRSAKLPEFESFQFDLYDDPSFPCPSPEPLDVESSVVNIGLGGRYITDISLIGGQPIRSPPRNRYIAAKTDISLKGGRPPRYRRAIFTTLVESSLIVETDAPVINNFDELNKDECFDPGGDEIDVEVDNSFTFITWIFLPYLTYPEVSPLLSSTKNEDTFFDPGIST